MKILRTLLCITFSALLLIACGSKEVASSSVSDTNTTVATSSSPAAETKPATSTKKPTEQYSFMSDRWNLYIASFLSDSVLKIEHWGRFTANEETPFKYENDISTIKINEDRSFKWLDEEQTAFAITLDDPDNSYLKEYYSPIVQFSIKDKDEIWNGSNYHKDQAAYSYLNDRWNLYIAIPLSENIIKIEQWNRFTANDVTPYVYARDLMIIDTLDNDCDFEWLDDEHSSFIITAKDPENGYWEEKTIVAFTSGEIDLNDSMVEEVGIDEETVEEKEETPEPTSTPETTKEPEIKEEKPATTTKNYKDYEAIYDEYAEKIRTEALTWIPEIQNAGDLMASAEKMSEGTSALAEIMTEGTGKMADLMWKKNTDYDEYSEWADKLYDVYSEEADKLFDEYWNHN